METTIPAIEKVKVHETSLTLYADMHLASIPVVVRGQYNIDSNCFYPSGIRFVMDLEYDEKKLENGVWFDLEEVCDFTGWDQWETNDLIQHAVENRDR